MSSRMLRSFRFAAALYATSLVAQSASAQTVYVGPNNGDWANPANWTLGTPNAALNAVVNANVSAVNVNLGPNQTGNANTLTIDLGDSVTLNNNSTLNLAGNLAAAGAFRFNVAGNESFLNFSNPSAT